MLLSVPVLVMILLFRPAKAARPGPSARAVVLACAIAAGASAVVIQLAEPILGRDMYFDEAWLGPALVMVSFGLLLPVGRGRPLWAIAPVACLVSLGGPAAIAGTLYQYTAFTFFRAAVPLTLIGLAGAGASALVARRRGFRVEDTAEQPRMRPVSFAYGLGLGALAVTTVMVFLDPLPSQLSTPLPTYLGARDRVVDQTDDG